MRRPVKNWVCRKEDSGLDWMGKVDLERSE